ncbi:MAG: permease prefix domain 1-containing protein [Clostridia bacterium]|nr:permease prefix domain 1-containing protein [Clostridia bacterium]
MPLPEFNSYTDRVLTHIKFRYDHEGIRQELNEHLEDMTEDYMSEGMTENEAVSMAVLNMGDPDEIGEELNKAHSPLLGIVWLAAKWLAGAVVLFSLFSFVFYAVNIIGNITRDYDDRQDAEIVYTVQVGEKFLIDDMNLRIDEAVYYDDNTLEVRYMTWDRPFSDSISWSFHIGSECFYDEKGNSYFSGSGGSGGGPFTKHYTRIEDFPADAEKLIVDYDFNGRKVYCEIPLKEGAVYEADK